MARNTDYSARINEAIFEFMRIAYKKPYIIVTQEVYEHLEREQDLKDIEYLPSADGLNVFKIEKASEEEVNERGWEVRL